MVQSVRNWFYWDLQSAPGSPFRGPRLGPRLLMKRSCTRQGVSFFLGYPECYSRAGFRVWGLQ